MAIGGGDAVSPTAALLTIALLSIPPLLACHPWLPSRLSRIAHLIPITLVGLAVLFRVQAMWIADGRDAQVVGWLPQGTEGMTSLAHIFDGPAGLMLGLLFGFALGIAIRPKDHVTLRLHRWAALCWIVILGWGTPSDGFARSIDVMPLSDVGSETDWRNLAYPLLGIGLSLVVLPTLSYAEISGLESLPTIRLIAAISISLLLLDISTGVAMSALMILLLGSMAHLVVTLWAQEKRGQAQRRRWGGLLFVFFYSAFFIIFTMAWLAKSDPRIVGFGDAIWTSRLTVGWILLCGLGGSLLPTVGWDARPRPEVWGFLSGLLFASALLPRMELTEHALLPILLLSVTIPTMASIVEHRPEFPTLHRVLESVLTISAQISAIFLVAMDVLPLTVVILMILLPVCWIHHSITSSIDEEE